MLIFSGVWAIAKGIGLDGSSCLLCGLCNSLSFDLVVAVVVSVLACPALELIVLLEQQLKGLADDVGRVRFHGVQQEELREARRRQRDLPLIWADSRYAC